MATTPVTSTVDASPDSRRFHWLVRVLLTMLGMFVMMIPMLIVAILLQALVPASTDTMVMGLLSQLPSLVMPLGAIGLLWVFMKYIDRRPLREAGLFFDRRSIPTFLLGFALLVVLQVGAAALTTALGFTWPMNTLQPVAWVYVADLLARALIHASFCEELLFRGYLMQTLPQRNPWVVASISAVAFGVLHILSQGQSGVERLAYFVGPTGWAFLAAALVLVFRNIAPAVGVHFGSYVGSDISVLLGNSEGPAAWIATGLIAAAVGAAIIAWHSRRQPQVPQPLFAG